MYICFFFKVGQSKNRHFSSHSKSSMTHVAIAILLKYQQKNSRVKKSIAYCYSPCHFIGDKLIDVEESKLCK